MNDSSNMVISEFLENDQFHRAGLLTGTEFAKYFLDLTLELNDFASKLQKLLKDYNIDILDINANELNLNNITLIVKQDIERDNMFETNKNLCNYNKAFVAGILETYTGKKYDIFETEQKNKHSKIYRFTANADAS